MARKYQASEFAILPRPRITLVPKQFGLVAYTWLCKCPSGSRGHGTTPAHAYAQWLKNWTRRQRWYTRNSLQVHPVHRFAANMWKNP